MQLTTDRRTPFLKYTLLGVSGLDIKMMSDALLSVLFSLLLVNAASARSTADVYDELVDVLKEIKELETDKEVDEGKRGSVTTRDYDAIKTALIDAEDVVVSYNDLKRFYYFRGGDLDAFMTPISTSAGKDYSYTLLTSPECAAGTVKAVIFEARACSSVHVGLKEDTDTDGNLYEIVIGADKNTRAIIRSEKQGNGEQSVTTKGLLDCNEYRTFFVGWEAGRIQVYRQLNSGWELVIRWQDPNPSFDVNFIGLTTAGFTTGHFRAQKRGDDLTIKTARQFGTVVYTMLQDNGFPIVQRPYLVFEVQTCNDAHIGLFKSETPDLDTDLEIIIGTDINERSVIRIGDVEVATSSQKNVVHCDEYRAFFISWTGGNIQVFRQTGKGWRELMSWAEKGERAVDYVGFTTSLFASGTWRISKTFETGLDAPAGDTSPETMAGLNNLDTDQTEIEEEEVAAVQALAATKILLDKGVFKSLKELQTNDEVLDLWSEFFDKCKGGKLVPVDCSGAIQYRTINGECNNLNHPHWGAAGTSQLRLLPAAYDDGMDSPRTLSAIGGPLPSARTVSVSVFYDPSNVATSDDANRSLMMMVWGQFIDHDVGETPIAKGYQSTTIQCCNIIDQFVRGKRGQCFSIPIESNDHAYTHDCMNFVRSTPARKNPCEPDVRQQMNAITSYLDGSMVYGSEHDVAESLRTHSNGLLKVNSNDLLPQNSDDACVRDLPSAHCFFAGDVRVNENPLLSTMHTAFVRYHNILAKRMLVEKPSLTDNQIYDMTRQIIGALIQSITYSKWLPSVLGPTIMDAYELNIHDDHVYDNTINGGIHLPFTSAALRYGHTLIRETIDHVDANDVIVNSHDLENVFFNPDPVFADIQGIGRGMLTRPCKASDPHFVPAIDHLLFKNKDVFGFDLSALNIQRARDHGLPGYVEYLEFCEFTKPNSFADLPFHNSSFQAILASVYSDVRDIDLFAGAMSEDSLEDAEVGPTFACLLANQFYSLRFGDRFWYQHDLEDDQITNVEEVELSKILCEVFQLNEIQSNAFILTPDRSDCADLTDIDVTLWTDKVKTIKFDTAITADSKLSPVKS